MSLLIKGVTAHTGLTDKDPAGVIDHAALSVTDGKIASGVGIADTQLLKLPVAVDGLVIKRAGGVWGAGSGGMTGVKARKNYQMPIIGTRPQLNLIEGAAIGLNIADNPSDDEIDLTISAKYPTQYMTLTPVDAILPAVNPAALATVDGANLSYDALDFDKDTEESAYFDRFLTPDYGNENIVVDIYWISTGAGNVKFGFKTGGRESGEAWDIALGTEQTVIQATAGAGNLNVARISTFAPGWAAKDNVRFKLARKAADGTDTLNADARVLKVVIQYTGAFSQSFYPVTRVELIPPGYGVWADIDVSTYVPVGATGVILEYSGGGVVSFRKKGSTDARLPLGNGGGHAWGAVGINGNCMFQVYLADATHHIYLVAYTASGVVFFENSYNKSPAGGPGVWQNIDCSVECPGAIGVIFQFETDVGWAQRFGIRKNGSADDRHVGESSFNTYAIIGCDAAQLINVWMYEFGVVPQRRCWLIGYITEGAVFKTNATDKTTGGVTGAYTDIDCAAVAASGIILFFEVYTDVTLFHVRKNGAADDNYLKGGHSWAMIPCDSGQIVEAKIANIATHFYLVGYATWAAP